MASRLDEMTPELSVIVAVFNEEEVLAELHRRLSASLMQLGRSYEILLVDDGSRDRSLEIMEQLRRSDPAHVRLLSFTRNFGHHVALTAGLDHARGETIVMMDADLQDQPEELHKLLAKLDEGYDVVWGEREVRQFSWYKNLASRFFVWLMNSVIKSEIPINSSIYRVMRRPVVDDLIQLREKARFLPGMVTWLGYRQASTPVVHGKRFAGHTKYSVWRLVKLALSTATSFSAAPLQLATIVGLIAAGFALLFLLYIVARKFLGGYPVGYASIVFAIVFFGALQLIVIGLMGEYISRIYREAQGRPLYLLRDLKPAPHTVGAMSARPISPDREEILALLQHSSSLPSANIFRSTSMDRVADWNVNAWLSGQPRYFEVRERGVLQAFALVTHLEWDSTLLGISCARVLHCDVNAGLTPVERTRVAAELGRQLQQFASSERIALMDLRVSSRDLLVMRAFESSGFHTVDVLTTLGITQRDYEAALTRAAVSSTPIRPLQLADIDTLAELSSKSFGETKMIQDRFFLEPSIDPARAENLFREWFLQLARKHQSGDGMTFVATLDGAPVGYLGMEKIIGPQGELVWKCSLNAVSPVARGRGVYSALVLEGIRHSQTTSASAFVTKTQASTTRVINTWLHLGGDFLESFVTLHWTPPSSQTR